MPPLEQLEKRNLSTFSIKLLFPPVNKPGVFFIPKP